jgi:hypothetical protein
MTSLRRVLCAVLVLTLLAGAVPVYAATEDKVEGAYTAAANYLCDAVRTPRLGPVGGEWLVLGLLRGGYEVPEGYYARYYEELVADVTAQGGVLSQRKYTEYSRVILALTAMGKDPRDVGGYDLLLPLGDFDKTVLQGISGPIWALIALDSGGYGMPENHNALTQATRELYVENILHRQLADGGFALAGTAADPDTTAMALLALAKYQDRKDVETASGKALSCLSALQEADGGYSSWGVSCAESTVQAILALCALTVKLDDPRFVKSGITLMDNLLAFQTENGGFAHISGADEPNQMATEQALLALAAVRRTEAEQSGLFEINDLVQTGRLLGDGQNSNGARHSLSFYYRKNAPMWEKP